VEYPSHLDRLHNDYPSAPDHATVTKEMLPPFYKFMNMSHAVTEKLAGKLQTRTTYKVHYRNLKLFLDFDTKLLRVRRVVAFRQQPWMKSYIELNTKVRQSANNDFANDFF
jgi:hypothetical protein